MEAFVVNEIIRSIGDGNYSKGLFLILVFVVIIFQIRGLKTEVKHVRETVDNGFKNGETRFSEIEKRLTQVEVLTKLKPQEG